MSALPNRHYRRLRSQAMILVLVTSMLGLLPFNSLHSQQPSLSILTNWTVRQQPGPNSLVSVTFGIGLFVAIGNSGTPTPYTGIILTSPDGVRWTQRFAQPNLYFREIAFHEGRFVAVSGVDSFGTTTAIVTSTNGLNWTTSPIAYSYPLYAVGGGNGKFIISGANYFYQTTLFVSTDGSSWRAEFSGLTPWITSVAHGAGVFVLGGWPRDQSTNRILRSADGATWLYSDPPTPDQQWRPIRDLIYGRDEFVALEQTFDPTNRYVSDVLISATGTKWERAARLTNQFDDIAIAYGGGLYVVAADSALHSSSDARYWAPHLANSFQAHSGVGVAYGHNTFVVVSYGGIILQSASVPSSIGPVIVTQPAGSVVWPGTNLTLMVGATGTPPLGHQWFFNGTNALAATAAALVLTNVQPSHAGNYYAVVTSPYGAVTTSVATVEVRPPTAPIIVSQPQSALFAMSSNAFLSVAADGSPPLQYQWRFNGSNLAAATNELLMISNTTPTNAGSYTVIVANSYGSVTSQVAVLTQWLSPIVQQPQNVTVTNGGAAVFTVVASGDSLTYQWHRNGIAIPGSTNSALVILNARYEHQTSYTVTVGQYGFHVLSDAAFLKVLMAPTITAPPEDQGAYEGQVATFSVSAIGTLPITYQWQFRGVELPGATNSVLIISNAQLAASGPYRVAVKTGNGSITSSVATLTVLGPLQVINLAATGFGSLEQALVNAHSRNGGHILLTNLAGTLTNSGRLLELRRDITITGPGADRLKILGSQILVASNSTCRLIDITLSGSGGDTVPLIRNEGTLHVRRCVVSGGGPGRGVVNLGTLSISDSALAGNQNRTGYFIPFCLGGLALGGALLIESGPVSLTNCTFSGNVAEFICYYPGDPSNASRSGSGAAIFSQAFQLRLAIVNCTFADNYSPNGSSISAVPTVFFNNIVADSLYPLAPSIPPQLGGTNLVGTGVRNTLGPLQLNGGTTPTHALLPGSPAIDLGTSNGVPFFDQRGHARPFGSGIDLGAFEFGALPVYTLLVTSAGSGRVEVNPSRPSYLSNSTVTVRALPETGSAFWQWSGGATGIANPLTISVTSNTQVTANFVSTRLAIITSGDGQVTAEPMREYYNLEEGVTLAAIPSRWHRFVQWGDGLTNNPRVITIGSNNNYSAEFVPIAQLETVTYGGVSRTAPVGMPTVFVDGKFVTNGAITNLRSAEITIVTSFANGRIFYGRAIADDPLKWKRYTNSFVVRRTLSLRAFAQSADLSETWEADPLHITVIPAFFLEASTTGGGALSISPTNAPYVSNTLVSVMATPASGWTFLQWFGDIVSTNPVSSVLMTSDSQYRRFSEHRYDSTSPVKALSRQIRRRNHTHMER